MDNNKLLKHLKKAAFKSDSRPILQCAHYGKDGSLSATDSHRLLKINDFHQHKEAFNLNLKTMEIMEENYPDTSRLFPDKEMIQAKVTVSLMALIRAAKALKTEAEETILIEITEDSLVCSNQRDYLYYSKPLTVTLPAQVEGEGLKIAVYVRHIIDCCDFLLDALDQLNNDEVTLYFVCAIRPFIAEIGDAKYQYLLTPMRRSRGDHFGTN